MPNRTSPANTAAVVQSLTARAQIDALRTGLVAGQQLGTVNSIALLRNLVEIEASLQSAMALLSERLEPIFGLDDPVTSATDVSRAFTVQIAQHYLDQSQQAAAEAAEALEHAMSALSSLEPNA